MSINNGPPSHVFEISHFDAFAAELNKSDTLETFLNSILKNLNFSLEKKKLFKIYLKSYRIPI